MKFWFGKGTASDMPARVDGPATADVSVPAPMRAGGAPVVQPSAPAESAAPAAPVAPVSTGVVPPAPSPASAPAASTRPQISQRDLYSNLMNALYDAVLVLDDEGHVVDCNSRVEAIFGYSKDDMWDRPVRDIIKGFGQQLLAKLAEPLRERRPVIIDGSCVRKDGTVFAAEIAIGSVRLARGENIVVSIRDVDKRMAAVMERLRSQGLAPAKPAAVVRLVSRKPAAPAASSSQFQPLQ